MSDARIAVEYGEQEKDPFSRGEKLLNTHIYVGRKLLLALMLLNLYFLRWLAKPFNFKFQHALSDREMWTWRPYKRLKRPVVEWKE